ncbi:MAG: tRNA 2-selenouridine(34) synthase MnmH [Gammaproteobacteria bacterium]
MVTSISPENDMQQSIQEHTKIYTELFLNDSPMMDVRAPIEFEKGAFPSSINLPIMDNQQREIVGTYYNDHGQDKAVEKGHELVQGEIREARIATWVNFAKQNPQGSLYCFRGGLRSKITQQWMQEAGEELPIIFGGYKALRTFLLNELENTANECSFTLIGGKTGSAKTILINELDNAIDLEAAAHHRGSSFGSHAIQQNNQINFENILAINFLKLRHNNILNIILEDEARTIGRAGLPKSLFAKMRESKLVVIEEPYEARLERLIQEYVVDMHSEFEALDVADAFQSFSNYLLRGLEKIQKRLGPARYVVAYKAMQQALKHHSQTGTIANHYDWLKVILENYYDPMYEDQLKKREQFICFRGNYLECKAYLEHTL